MALPCISIVLSGKCYTAIDYTFIKASDVETLDKDGNTLVDEEKIRKTNKEKREQLKKRIETKNTTSSKKIMSPEVCKKDIISLFKYGKT